MKPAARIGLLFLLLSAISLFGGVSALCTSALAADLPTTRPATSTAPVSLIFHLPGIAGEMQIDHNLVAGLIAGGVAPEAAILDWTGQDRGVPALTNVERHHVQARKLAEKITAAAAASTGVPIVLTAHSAGTGIAVEALENLPPGVNIQTLVLLASALSPGYDLTPALRHVDGHALSFYSQYDEAVLSKGTRVFGTYDRVRTDAAGYIGFTQPATADAAMYAKLTQYPYDSAWLKLGNDGSHIGPMNARWAKAVLAPLINNSLINTSVDPKKQ